MAGFLLGCKPVVSPPANVFVALRSSTRGYSFVENSNQRKEGTDAGDSDYSGGYNGYPTPFRRELRRHERQGAEDDSDFSSRELKAKRTFIPVV
jgi:hypothetical protein